MKSLIQIGLIVIIVILSGCADGEIQLRPEKPAFQDDFTREFMDSTKEVQEGYYRFKLKTEGYTMLFR